MGALLVKPGVDFGTYLAPAGARILEVLKALVAGYDFDLTITSARDGAHSGPSDPHHFGEAFDIRSQDLPGVQKARVLADLQAALYRVDRRFYAFLEDPGTPNEHIHAQRRSGQSYDILDYLQNR